MVVVVCVGYLGCCRQRKSTCRVQNHNGTVWDVWGEEKRQVWLKAGPQGRRAKLMAWHVVQGKIRSFNKCFPSPGWTAQLVGPQSMLGPFYRGRKASPPAPSLPTPISLG